MKQASKIPDWYQVEYLHRDGSKRFGVMERYGEDAERWWRQGMVIVGDAVTPDSYVLPVSQVREVPLHSLNCRYEDEPYYKYVTKHFEEARAASDKLGDGCKPGKLFRIGVGDGYAWYVVTKVTKRTATVDWRGFSPDRYVAPLLGWGGSFPLQAIANEVQGQDEMNKLFGGKGKK